MLALVLALLPPDSGLSLVQRAALVIGGVSAILFVALLIAERRSKRRARRDRTARLLGDALRARTDGDEPGRHRRADG